MRSKKATLGSWMWATISLPPRSAAVVTAKRTSGAPEAESEAGEHGEAVALPQPVGRVDREQADGAGHLAVPRTQDVDHVGAGVVAVDVGAVEQALLHDEHLVADAVVQLQLLGGRRRPAHGPCPGRREGHAGDGDGDRRPRRPATRGAPMVSACSIAPMAEHAWHRAHPAATPLAPRPRAVR